MQYGYYLRSRISIRNAFYTLDLMGLYGLSYLPPALQSLSSTGRHNAAFCPMPSHDESSSSYHHIYNVRLLRHDTVWTLRNALRKHEEMAHSSSISLSIGLSHRADLYIYCAPLRLIIRSNAPSCTMI